MLYDNILETIGKTPLVKLNSISYDDVNVFGKLEYFNPSGSVKDRAAYNMILEATSSGAIDKDTVIIEPTSGNTGIGLAMVCAALKMKLILTMPENMSVERIKVLKAYGAEIVLTPKSEGMRGSIEWRKGSKPVTATLLSRRSSQIPQIPRRTLCTPQRKSSPTLTTSAGLSRA